MAEVSTTERPARAHPYSSPTRAGVRLLGAEIARERKRAAVTAADLAERARISLVTLRPCITFAGADQPDAAEVARLHHLAHDKCYIANSVRSEVRIDLPLPG